MRHIQRECAAGEDYSKIWPNCPNGRANQTKRWRAIGCPRFVHLGWAVHVYILAGCHPLGYIATS